MSHNVFFSIPHPRTHPLSERDLAKNAGLSRNVVRGIFSGKNVTVKSLELLVGALENDLHILSTPREVFGECSTVATALFVERDGFDSWKIHFFNFVDEFQRTRDARLFMLPPHRGFDERLRALLASIVWDLAEQSHMAVPRWAKKQKPLLLPWFVSGVESLKASALMEAPIAYRANNVFVLGNFLDRA